MVSVHFVDAVDDGIEAAHLLKLLGVDVEEVLLDGIAGTDSHDDDSCLLISVALPVNLFKHFACCLYDGGSAACGGDEPHLLIIPVLGEVFTERVGV